VSADNSPSDADLIDRGNRGEAQAFEELYVRHRDWVAALAYRFTGDREEALDVLQDTFSYFFGKFPGFALTAALRTFLYPTVKHLCLTRLRQRRPTVDIDDLAEMLVAPEPASGTADLNRLVRSLPAAQREVVLLRFVDDFSLEQIAAALNIPLGTVKSRLHNALEALRQRI
jgi:RNA polymerase sigma-70 factor (ECF subfamily)